jgi:hypothetical protein
MASIRKRPLRKKSKPFINFALHCEARGNVLPLRGLCNSIGGKRNRKILLRFRPDWDDIELLERQGLDTAYWASGMKETNIILSSYPFVNRLQYGLTPLRKTIIAFCAVLNGEV